MKLWKLSLLCLLAALLFTVAAAVTEQNGISEKLIRLHVIANSDSTADQTVKLQVRDAVLKRLEGVTWKDREDAARWLSSHKEELAATAEEISKQPAEVLLSEECYPTREYDTFSLPAGEYLSLQIRLGAGAGKNWWCVVYPALCAYSERELSPVAASAGFTPEEIELMTDDSAPIQVKFKLLEWLAELKNAIQDA